MFKLYQVNDQPKNQSIDFANKFLIGSFETSNEASKMANSIVESEEDYKEINYSPDDNAPEVKWYIVNYNEVYKPPKDIIFILVESI